MFLFVTQFVNYLIDVIVPRVKHFSGSILRRKRLFQGFDTTFLEFDNAILVESADSFFEHFFAQS